LPGVGGQPRKSYPGSSSPWAKRPSLKELVLNAEKELRKTKLAHRAKSFWYPYATLKNIIVLDRVLESAGLNLLDICRGEYGKIADIGAADGDIAFFLEELGFSVDLIDNEYTNFNKLDGARILKEVLNSSVTIRSVDLASRSQLFEGKYDAAFLLGILYHLKNPFYILERLAHVSALLFSEHTNRQTDC
jgi:2-polyprenyl-3-methyl-5-hydroxy-6-metoxy-1,4-benzoquinol methylase